MNDLKTGEEPITDDAIIAGAIVPADEAEGVTRDPEIDDIRFTLDPTEDPTEVTASTEPDHGISDVDLTPEVVSVRLAIDRIIGALSEPLRVTDDSLSALMRLGEALQSPRIVEASNRAFGVRNDAFARWLRDEGYDVSAVHDMKHAAQWGILRRQWHDSTNR